MRPRIGPAVSGGSPSIRRTTVSAGTSDASEESEGVQRLASIPGPVTTIGFVAVLGQVAHELYGALNPGAADRREVVGEEENPFHSEGSGTRPNSRTTRAGTPTATA